MARDFGLLLAGFLVGAATVFFLLSAPEPAGLPSSPEGTAVGVAEPGQRVRLMQTAPGRTAGPGVDEAGSGRPGSVVRLAPDESTGSNAASDPNTAFSAALGADGAEPETFATALHATAAAGAADAPAATLPAAYRNLLEPPNPRRLRPDEIFSQFSAEARDEAWAYPMELGINQHIASMHNTDTVIESVECRQTACVIAGYSVPGAGDEWRGALQEMTQSGWWQAAGPTMFMSSSGEDGVARFVTVHPRTPADAMEFTGTDLPPGVGDPNVQNLGIVVTTAREGQ